jgi:hypothetical protein
MITIILIMIAAMCNAVMDIISHKYAWSIFHEYNDIFMQQWWDPRHSWKNKYKISRKKWYKPVQFSDAWHTFKTIMIFCLMAAVITFDFDNYNFFNNKLFNFLLCYGVLGTTWNLTFVLFYKRILRV